MINYWTDLSIQYAEQKSYLDDLFSVYPTIPEGIREIDNDKWRKIENAFETKNNIELIRELLKLELFPIKDSYVAYLKRDPASIDRNPQTLNRLSGRVYELGLTKLLEKATEPKETNRQIGPLFRRWLKKGTIGCKLLPFNDFLNSNENSILDAGDAEMMSFANQHLGYNHDKGLDFVGKFNGKYVIGEAKFLTDFGGHQNAQFNDAITTIKSEANAVKIAILDGVLYIRGNNKMFNFVRNAGPEMNIMSSLVLREFLYSI